MIGPTLVPRWTGTLAGTPATGWDAATRRRSFFLSHTWLRGAEGELTPRPRYLTVEAGGRLLAAAPGQVVGKDEVYLYYDIPRLLSHQDQLEACAAYLDGDEPGRLRAAADRLNLELPQAYPGLVMAASGMAAGLGLAPGLDAGGRGAVVSAAVDALLAEGDRMDARVRGFCYLPDGGDPELVAELRARGFAHGVFAAECNLPVRWSEFDEYVASLSRNRRTAVRREVGAFQRGGLTAEYHDVSGLTDELADLQAALRRHYGHPTDDEAIRRSYQRMRDELGPHVRVLVARDRHAAAVGFVLFFEADRAYYIKSAGFDYAATAGTFCYFNLLFYSMIESAIAHGIRSIHYGLESYDAKVSRGGHIVPLHAYLRFDGACAEHLNAALALRDLAVRRQIDAVRAKYLPKESTSCELSGSQGPRA